MRIYVVLLFLLGSLYAEESITPIPLTVVYDKEKAALGKSLFFDEILSSDGSVSCASCHRLPGNGADKKAFSFGINANQASINTPTVLNSRFNFSQFWDGRAKDLHEQALQSIFNPDEMGQSIEQAIQRLSNSEYKEKFAKIYGGEIKKEYVAEVIAEFEKALITPNSRFDQYLRGDITALNEQEKKGYKAFKDLGCISCHNGVNIGGNMYQKLGTIIEYDHVDPSKDNSALEGRFNVTQRLRDKRVFKVPSLRNVALTAPYFHDGAAETLEDAIMDMREHQLGILEESDEVKDIEMFLKTLTGESPAILEGTK